VTDGWADGRTDGIAVASTALAMPALRHTVKSNIIDNMQHNTAGIQSETFVDMTG